MSDSHAGPTHLPTAPRRPRLALTLFHLLPPLLLFCAAFIPHLAEARQDDDDVVRVDSDLVLLNATVTDREGRYVHKLQRSEFRIFEDGREQAVSVFSVEETPFAASILIDTSGSMEGRLSLARAAAIRFLDGLREDDVASVYHFGTEVEQLQEFTTGRDLPPLAYGLSPKGMTALNDAVVRAARDLSARAEKRRAIILISDGADTKSAATAGKALAAALAADATIYTVDMMDPQAKPADKLAAAGALKSFAGKSGGRYISTPGGRALNDALEAIVAELRNQYTLGYRPANRTRDGRWRSIELKLARPEAKVRTRGGYHAPKF